MHKKTAAWMLAISTLAFIKAMAGNTDVSVDPMMEVTESSAPLTPSESVVEVVIKDSGKETGMESVPEKDQASINPATYSQHQNAGQGATEAILKAKYPIPALGNGGIQDMNEQRWEKSRRDAGEQQKQFDTKRRHRSTDVWQSYQHEKCYVINTDMVPVSEVGKVIDQFRAHPSSVKFVYKKNILGFAFCTANSGIIDRIREKYALVNVEEDKTFRVGSVENDARLRQSRKAADAGSMDSAIGSRSKPGICMDGTVRIGAHGMIQSPVPTHFYRIMNMGNAFLNNYFLDNIVFRMLGISSLIRHFYSHEYFYTGRNVKVAIVDTPRCNEHSQINSSLIAGLENSLAKNSSLYTIEALGCDGTVKLSRLLDALERMPKTDILVLPFSGPYSEVLNLSLKRMAQSTVIIAASGNDSENSCNYSPSGHHLIKIGSVNKHGYISTFSNRGSCTNMYTLGEDILGGSGTSYSASFAASAAAVFMEKHPGASYDRVLRHLMDNTMKNEYNSAILKIPRVDPRADTRMELPYYTWKGVAIYNAALMAVLVAVVYGLLRIYGRSRARSNEQYTTGSLR